jgi:hypothetical protein
MSPEWGSTPRQTDWLTVNRNVTWTWTWMLVQVTLTLLARKHHSTDVSSRHCQTSSARHHAPVAASHSASLLGRTRRRKPASRYSARTARYGSMLGRTTGRPANCKTNAPFKGQRFRASQLTRGKLRPASSRHARLPSANRYALRPFSGPTNSSTNWLRHNCPLQGQQTLQQGSWHYENLAWLPWSSVTLIVNICYSGCLRTRVTTSHNHLPADIKDLAGDIKSFKKA